VTGKKAKERLYFQRSSDRRDEIRPATYLLFTMRPNSLMAEIHNRMPAIVTGEGAQRWIAPWPVSPEQLAEFTELFPAEEMVARPVSTLINSPRNDSPDCIAPTNGPFRKAAPY